jgi:hypothetical protein
LDVIRYYGAFVKMASGQKSANISKVPVSDCRERLWDKLCRSPSIFGRLVAISGLWNDTDGHYEYPQCRDFGAAVVDRTLREIHLEAFTYWLGFRLAQQERDLSVWLAWTGRSEEEGARILESMTDRLSALVPPQHLEHERQLFLHDLHIVLARLRWAQVDTGERVWPRAGKDDDGWLSTVSVRFRGYFKSSASQPHRP